VRLREPRQATRERGHFELSHASGHPLTRREDQKRVVPSPRSIPWQSRLALRQLVIHVFSMSGSQPLNQSAWIENPPGISLL
jgi:hypothetical protein